MLNMLLLATAAFILLTVLLGKALNIRNQSDLTNVLLVLFFLGEWFTYGSYALSVIPGIETVLGVFFSGVICLVVGACLPEKKEN